MAAAAIPAMQPLRRETSAEAKSLSCVRRGTGSSGERRGTGKVDTAGCGSACEGGEQVEGGMGERGGEDGGRGGRRGAGGEGGRGERRFVGHLQRGEVG